MALTVRQPWAWLIIHGGKDVENRTWRAYDRGPLLIHAAVGMTRREYDECQYFLVQSVNRHRENMIVLPRFEALERGGIIGQVELVDCVSQMNSPWFVGPYGFVVKDAMQLPFVPCKGALGFWECEV